MKVKNKNAFYIISDASGEYFLWTLSRSKKETIDFFIWRDTEAWNEADTWKHYYRLGYRCEKVRIENFLNEVI